MKKKDMKIHITKLEEALRQRGEGRVRKSVYFILLNPNMKAGANLTDEDIRRELIDIVTLLAANLDKIITFNKEGHNYSKEYILKVRIRFAIEKGFGRRRKDGTYPEDGGTIHIHIVLYIEHVSNITVSYDKLDNFIQEEFVATFGKRGFVSKPRLIQQDQTEDYMTKSETYRNGYKWVTLDQ